MTVEEKWKNLVEKMIEVRNNYTDEEWVDKTVKPEIDADIRWWVELMTKYEVNW